MLLSVLIVSYNTAELTVAAVNSAVKNIESSTLLHQKSEIIVIDNNSADTSVTDLKKIAARSNTPIHIIENDKNTGFAAANNQGIDQAQGKYIVLLNSDTLLFPRALEKMVSTFESVADNEVTATLSSQRGVIDHLGILAATLLNQDGSPQPQGGNFPSLASLTTHMLLLDDLPLIGQLLPSTQHTGKNSRESAHSNFTALVQQDWVGGTAMMIKRDVIQEVGPLDENIFMYGEDVEFCLRASHHHWDIAILPSAFVTHLGSASSSSERAIIGELKGYSFIFAKHFPIWQLHIARLIMRLGCVLRILLFGTILGNKKKAKAYKAALSQV